MNPASYEAVKDSRPSIAVVIGARSGIGRAIAIKIASFPFVETVVAVSRSIQSTDVDENTKIVPFSADITTEAGRLAIVDYIQSLCATSNDTSSKKQLRYLVHSAATIEPIKSVLKVTPDEMRRGMALNCEAPFFLSIALYPYMVPIDEAGEAGRILHVSSGTAHNAPPRGWSVYGVSKAAFFQSYRVLEHEFRYLGSKVIVGSFKPGVVATPMQAFAQQNALSSTHESTISKAGSGHNLNFERDGARRPVLEARPPPKGVPDCPNNVAHFAAWLLLGTSDMEFTNQGSADEYDIRNSALYEKWIRPQETDHTRHKDLDDAKTRAHVQGRNNKGGKI